VNLKPSFLAPLGIGRANPRQTIRDVNDGRKSTRPPIDDALHPFGLGSNAHAQTQPATSCARGHFICLQNDIYAALRINWTEEYMQLKSMSVDKLVALKTQVEAALSSKVANERRALESKLATLNHFQGGKSSKLAFRSGLRGAVAPKYRNPENPSETWAGRGLKPRWLATAIKSGKKQEDFLIAGATPTKKTNGSKKARKTRK
jgi:DNA-binding protein H-NS